jgi:biotin-(acetyl-CoA carboxylase) ligase
MPFKKVYDNPNGIPREWITKYSMAKAQARALGQEWAFELEDWYDMWERSGVKEHRGHKIHQYCMVRKDPIEAWGAHNCIIVARRTHMRKHCYEKMLKTVKTTEWTDSHDINYEKDNELV